MVREEQDNAEYVKVWRYNTERVSEKDKILPSRAEKGREGQILSRYVRKGKILP
jgi:hypothetical protein